MKSLFSKIFVGVWLSHLLAALLVYAILNMTRPAQPDNAGADGGPRGQMNNRGEGRRHRDGGPPAVPFGKFQFVQFAAILASATITAYGLARYFAAPASKLRDAAHALAAGELSTRVAPQMGKRRDELADLGRDFDLMAQRLEALLASERRLLGDISHELRSPLARMQVALDLAGQGADADTRKYLERIEREGARLNDLIGQLLALTRLETVAVEARREPIELSELIAQIAADADFEARGVGREVKITQCEECQVMGNEELLRSAIENVVRNALHYTPEDSAVEISLTKARGESTPMEALIRVRDFGAGVPEESLAKLFEPFYRVESARDRKSGGVGLGLSITARAARFHGGRVLAQNAEGGGLLVEIHLPITQ